MFLNLILISLRISKRLVETVRKLDEVRVEIEEIDKEMIKLFEWRMNCSKEVILYKLANNLPILDSAREALLIEKNSKLVSEDLRKYYVEFLKGVIEVSKDYQKDIKDNE